MRCKNPISLELLVAYWLGEVSETRAATLEEHFFGCAHCTQRAEALVALAAGVRAAVRDGKLSMAVSTAFVEAMKQAGLHVREYRVEPGGSVNCTIRADDDAVISRLRAPLAGVTRLDVVSMPGAGGTPEERLIDVPFDAQTGEVLMIPSARRLKTMPTHTLRMQLLAVSETGERPIGDYTFNHTPS